MKKIATFIAAMLFVVMSFAQTVTVTNYADTLTNAQTKYYPFTVNGLVYGVFQCYADHVTGTTDSTHVSVEASSDNSTWVTLASGNTYSGTTQSSSHTTKSFYTTDEGMVWYPADPLIFRYYRYKVQHYATGQVRIKAYLYWKK